MTQGPRMRSSPLAEGVMKTAEGGTTTTTAEPDDASSWNYRHQSDWPDWYASCGSSGVQSPLDLTRWENSNSGGLQFFPPSADNTRVTLETTTWTRVVHWGTQTSEEAKIIFNDKTYYLRNFSYRSPSENTIQGEYRDMEVQYQHQSVHGDGLVLAVRMVCESGSDRNDFMHQFWTKFPDTTEETSTASVGNPYAQGNDQALPKDLSFYRWTGTWSNPPCTRDQTWVLFDQTVQCSSEQMRLFREDINDIPDNKLLVRNTPAGVSSNWDSSLGCNNRDLQSTGSRTVYFHQQSGNTGGSSGGHSKHHSSPRDWYQRWWVWLLLCLLYLCCAGLCIGGAYAGSEAGLFEAAKNKKKEPREEEVPLQQEKPPKVLDMEYPEEDHGAPYHIAKPKHHHPRGQHQVQTVGDFTYVPSYGRDARSSYQHESFSLPPSGSLGPAYSSHAFAQGPQPQRVASSFAGRLPMPSAAFPSAPHLPPTAAMPPSTRRADRL
eukprot:CAMPEP_0178408046 /NCGR_PEP_ID=MMETSP0689_2-20121128/19738_1 /TAXON_ID=160604 /ORGANISM="Amphidinium massartii, Strain CS-259" /LENGTH=489 /DNA_ID=CAMNT_0020029131 /DNA_START=180 /DNA_END=1645 /DNA_ORIENTATION=-